MVLKSAEVVVVIPSGTVLRIHNPTPYPALNAALLIAAPKLAGELNVTPAGAVYWSAGAVTLGEVLAGLGSTPIAMESPPVGWDEM